MAKIKSYLNFLFWPAPEAFPRINLFYLPLMSVTAAIFGSVTSVLVIAGMLWALVQLARPQLDYSRDKNIHIVALCFASLAVIEIASGLANFTGRKTLMQFLENMPFLGLLPLYSVFYVSRNRLRHTIERAAILCSVLALSLALIQFELYGLRAEGNAGNAGVFGAMCLILFTLNFLAMVRNSGPWRWIAILAAGAAICAVILSGTRSLWPAFLLIPSIIIFMYWRFARMKISKISLAALFVLATMSGAVFYHSMNDRIEAGRRDIAQLEANNYNTSLGQRLLLWQAALELIEEKPLLGHGPGAVQDLIVQKTKEISGYSLGFSHFHNFILTHWVRSGLLGVCAVLAILIVPVLLAYRHVKDESGVYGSVLLVSLVAIYVVSGLFGIMFTHDIMDTVYISLAAISLFMVFHREPEAPNALRLPS